MKFSCIEPKTILYERNEDGTYHVTYTTDATIYYREEAIQIEIPRAEIKFEDEIFNINGDTDKITSFLSLRPVVINASEDKHGECLKIFPLCTPIVI